MIMDDDDDDDDDHDHDDDWWSTWYADIWLKKWGDVDSI